MNKKNILVLTLVIIILVCVTGFFLSRFFQTRMIDNFMVDYHAEYSSGGGTRILDITYKVVNGSIVSCNGTYTFPGTINSTSFERLPETEPCDVQRLLANDSSSYNVPHEFVTSISEGQSLSKEVTDGGSMYSYKIILE
ncbi:MAG: hypothetical protein M1165_02200 [Candidatus Pacearchaeota archaeon]|nr:hypothetical protein [Candidatus Pacearchaeota archaeon]